MVLSFQVRIVEGLLASLNAQRRYDSKRTGYKCHGVPLLLLYQGDLAPGYVLAMRYGCG